MWFLMQAPVYLASCARINVMMCAETYVVLNANSRLFSELRTSQCKDVRRNVRGS